MKVGVTYAYRDNKNLTLYKRQKIKVAMSSDFCKHTVLTFQLQHEIELGVNFKKMIIFLCFVSCVSDNPSFTKKANLLLM